MRLVDDDKLKIGDWVITSDDISKGKFQIGKIKGYRIEKLCDLDIDKNKVSNETTGYLDGECCINVLNKSELSKLLKLKTKFEILKGLRKEIKPEL